jgi:multidrug efflux pump subunit AcrB
VQKSIKNRYQTVSIFVGVLLVSFSLLAGGWVKWQFFPVLEAEEIAIVIDLPEGTPINITENVTKMVETEALKLKNELNSENNRKIISHVMTTIGDQYFSAQEAESSPTGPVLKASDQEKSIVGSLVGTWAELYELMELADKGLVKLSMKEYKLEEANQALHDLNDGKIKGRAVLVP